MTSEVEAQVRPVALLRQTPAAALVGVACAVSLLALSLLAEGLQHLVWTELSGALGADPDSWWWIVGVLTVFGFAIGLVVRNAPGHAGPDPAVEELGSDPLPPLALPGLALALVLTLASGASLGPENPILIINASLMVLVGMRLMAGVAAPTWMQWSLAGTFGAMFGTPVAAALLLTEALAGMGPDRSGLPVWNRLFNPLVAASTGSVVVLLTIGPQFEIAVPEYDGIALGDFAWAVGVALVTGALGLGASYLLTPVHRLFHRLPGPVAALTVGGFVLGWLGVLGGPETLFKGLEEMKEISEDVADHSAGTLVLMALVKLLALVVAAAAGFRGGRIFPAVFVGVAAGWAVVGIFDAAPVPVVLGAAVLGITIAAIRSGWLALFGALIVVPDIDLLPVLLIAALAVWLLVAGRHELHADPPPAPALR
ncbi:ion channel protein [Nocardioides sp. YIM 152588]|uniref:ion channel protein n=1 Tax=Nocardioides sp. YIM 152588 TaxID=3158259 RepID=UPI0032E4DF83